MNGKTYSEEDRQHFAAHIDDRAHLRPAECHGGIDCWVEFGPPAMVRKLPGSTTGNLYCVGCGGTPAMPAALSNRGGRYGR